MQDLVYAIDENVVDYFILVPKYFPMPKVKKKNYIRGQVRRFKENDEKIVIEILENFNFVFKWYFNDFYDIFFEVNRITFQLQHCALSFLRSEHLFDILIENELYYQTPTFDAPLRNYNVK